MKHTLIALFSLFAIYVNAAPSVGYQAATNIAARVTSNVVTKAYVESLGISGGGADTNAVNDLISSYVTTNAVTTNLMARVGDTATNVVSEILFIYDESFTQKKRDYADMTASTNWHFKGWTEQGFQYPLYVVATRGRYGSTKWQLWAVIDGESVKLSDVDNRDEKDLEVRFENVGSMGFEVIARRCSYEEDDTLATVKTILQGTITPTAATNAAQTVIDKNIETNNLCTIADAQAMTNALGSTTADAVYEERGLWKTGEIAWIPCRFDGSKWSCFDDYGNAITISRDGANMHLIIIDQMGSMIVDATMTYDDELGEWIVSTERFKLSTGYWRDTASNAKTLDFLTPAQLVSSLAYTNGGARAYADYVGATTLAYAKDYTDSYATDPNAVRSIIDSSFVGGTNAVKNSVLKTDPISFSNSYAEWNFAGVADYAEGLRVGESPSTDYNIQFFMSDLKWGRTNGTAHDYIAFHSDLSSFAPKLTGRVYDFANGSNFTKTLYTALTNVIQTLGGSVTNAPSFE